MLGFLGSKPNRPQPKPKAKGKARAMQATRPQEESETVDPAPTVLDPESERKPLFTSTGEDEHHLFSAGPPKAKAKAKAPPSAKVVVSPGNQDCYALAKIKFATENPEGDWMVSQERQAAIKALPLAAVRRRRFEGFRPDLFVKQGDKWQTLEMGELD